MSNAKSAVSFDEIIQAGKTIHPNRRRSASDKVLLQIGNVAKTKSSQMRSSDEVASLKMPAES